MIQDKKSAPETSAEDILVTEVYLVNAIVVGGTNGKFWSTKTNKKFPLVIRDKGSYLQFETQMEKKVNGQLKNVVDITRTPISNALYWK